MTAPSELSNDRAVVDRLTLIVIVALICAVITGLAHGPESLTASLGTIAIGGAGALAARRTRPDSPTEDTVPTQPPPLPPELANAWRDAQGGQP